jgi:5-methyltetrahydropteroyltriglutamate--homocysteine methyltransferase
MGLKTTCIGAFPKPDYLPIKDWFSVDHGLTDQGGKVTRDYTQAMQNADTQTETLFVRATSEAVEAQVNAGIDVPSDGEQRRENYIHYHCRHLDGFDFENLTARVLRDGAYETELPTIRGPIRAPQTPDTAKFLARDYEIAQSFTKKPVKVTVPGPLTIMDTTVNAHYEDERKLAADLADALNVGVRALADAGCTYIQVDEPLFARSVDRALAFGVDALDRCFHKVPANVIRVMHMCCGYPNHVDDEEYHKADPQSYFDLAEAIDRSSVHQVSIEDAHRHNDLSLLEVFERSTVLFGAVAIAKSRVEPVEEVVERLQAALEHIDKDRLWAAPDCGLGLIGHSLARAKLDVLCRAAEAV